MIMSMKNWHLDSDKLLNLQCHSLLKVLCLLTCIFLLASDKPIWIVSDIRRKTDIRWFKETYPELIRTIRITADDETRIKRGFHFQDGVDNAQSECDLDDFKEWDLVIENSENRLPLEEQLGSILKLLSHL